MFINSFNTLSFCSTLTSIQNAGPDIVSSFGNFHPVGEYSRHANSWIRYLQIAVRAVEVTVTFLYNVKESGRRVEMVIKRGCFI